MSARTTPLIAALLLLASCGRGPTTTEAPKPTAPPEATATEPTPALDGAVQGVIRGGAGGLDDVLPAGPVKGCPSGGAAGNVRLDADRGLADAIVLLRRGTRNANAPKTEAAAGGAVTHTVDLKGCTLARKAIVAHVGDTLEIHSADDRYHALGYSELDGGQVRRIQTLPFAPKERGVRFTLGQPGFYSLVSDQLPWLRGLVLVLRPGEVGAVTKPDGEFRVEALPAGSWNATVRHESLGAKDTTVEVVSGETAALYEVLGGPSE